MFSNAISRLQSGNSLANHRGLQDVAPQPVLRAALARLQSL